MKSSVLLILGSVLCAPVGPGGIDAAFAQAAAAPGTPGEAPISKNGSGPDSKVTGYSESGTGGTGGAGGILSNGTSEGAGTATGGPSGGKPGTTGGGGG